MPAARDFAPPRLVHLAEEVFRWLAVPDDAQTTLYIGVRETLQLIEDVVHFGTLRLDVMEAKRLAALKLRQDEVLTRDEFLDGVGWAHVQEMLATERGRKSVFESLAGSLEARIPASEFAAFVRAFDAELDEAAAARLLRQVDVVRSGTVGRKEFVRVLQAGLAGLLSRSDFAKKGAAAERECLEALESVGPISPEPSPRVKLDVPPSRYLSSRRRVLPASAPPSPSRGAAGLRPPPTASPRGSAPPSPRRTLLVTGLVPLFNAHLFARPGAPPPPIPPPGRGPTRAPPGPPRKGRRAPSARRRAALFGLFLRALAAAPWLGEHAANLSRLGAAARLAGVDSFDRPPPPPSSRRQATASSPRQPQRPASGRGLGGPRAAGAPEGPGPGSTRPTPPPYAGGSSSARHSLATPSAGR